MEELTLARLLAECREELDDDVAPYLWSDPRLTSLLNESVSEAAIRARLLVESQREDICQITLVPNVSEYELHPSVVIIRRAVLASEPSEPLLRTTTNSLDRHRCDWRAETGKPRYLVRDAQTRHITVSPTPTAADVLHLTVWRTPTEDELMEDDEDAPCIDRLNHAHLFHWACYRALNKRDSEQNSTKDAANHLALFEAHFGPRPTARELQQLSIDALGHTEPVWF